MPIVTTPIHAGHPGDSRSGGDKDLDSSRAPGGRVPGGNPHGGSGGDEPSNWGDDDEVASSSTESTVPPRPYRKGGNQ